MSLASDLAAVVLLSLAVSGSATLLAAGVGIPLGCWLGVREFRGKALVRTVTHTLYGLPPVFAGLVIYLLLSSQGPLGSLQLLFTPAAMILAQFVLVLPIITGLAMSAVSDVPREVTDTARTLGASERQVMLTTLSEAGAGIASAVMVGFGRAIAEVGAVMIVGGNIKWHTRVLTTAIVLETRRGNFEYALALGGILLAAALGVFLALSIYQGREAAR